MIVFGCLCTLVLFGNLFRSQRHRRAELILIGMFDQFLRNKINSLFDKFIEDKPGETNIRKWDGIIEMHDLRLKRTLVDLLCPILGRPLC